MPDTWSSRVQGQQVWGWWCDSKLPGQPTMVSIGQMSILKLTVVFLRGVAFTADSESCTWARLKWRNLAMTEASLAVLFFFITDLWIKTCVSLDGDCKLNHCTISYTIPMLTVPSFPIVLLTFAVYCSMIQIKSSDTCLRHHQTNVMIWHWFKNQRLSNVTLAQRPMPLPLGIGGNKSSREAGRR